MRIIKTVLSLAVLLVAVAAKGAVVTLTGETGEVTLENGDVLTGTGGTETHVTIAAGATVTLRDVNITAISTDTAYLWAGSTGAGDATIVLEGGNALKGGHEDYPGIYVPVGGTLTIKGFGALNAGSNGYGAGIGGGYHVDGGNIVIAGGTITAVGGDLFAAGIGRDRKSVV